MDFSEQNEKNLEARPDRRSLRRQDDRTGSPLHLLRELGMEGESESAHSFTVDYFNLILDFSYFNIE